MKLILVITFFFVLLLVPCVAQDKGSSSNTKSSVNTSRKNDFIELLNLLPKDIDPSSPLYNLYTAEALEKASSYIPVIFSLTENDIQSEAIPSVQLLSLGMLGDKRNRDFAISHFSEINHPDIKMYIAVILFHQSRELLPEITSFLKASLRSENQKNILSKIIGKNFKSFKRRINKHSSNK